MNFTAKVDDAALQAALKSLTGRDLPAAINFAINRAATTLKAEAAREVAKSYALKISTLKANTIDVEKSRVSTLTANVRIKGTLIPLGEFGNPRQLKKGVKVTVKRGAGRTMYKHAFLANVRGGKQQVYWRAIESGKRVGRGPLKILLGPSVAQIISAPAFVAKLMRIASERITDTLRQQIKSRVENAFKRRGPPS